MSIQGEDGERLRVVSHFPGRLRVRADRFRGSSSVAAEVVERLTGQRGVTTIRHAPATGSLLFLYDPRLLPLEDLLDDIVAFARLDGVAVDPAPSDILAQPDMGARVRQSFGTVDDAVRVATDGKMDLKVGFPLALGAAGVAMFFTRKRVLPQWYDLLIWSFNSFMALNQRGIIHEEIREEIFDEGHERGDAGR